MAKKDAIFDYSSSFDTTHYLAPLQASYEANKASAWNDRMEHNWSGDPSAALATPLAGWEAGTWKVLTLWDIAHETSWAGFPEDFDANDKSAAHAYVRAVKSAFNLPNPITLSAWKDEPTYTPGEDIFFHWQSRDREQMMMNISTNDTMPDFRKGSDPGNELPMKCGLVCPVAGYPYDADNDNIRSFTVRPTATNVTTYNNHFQTLKDASTAAADYTNPTLVGSEFSQAGSMLLINYENQWTETPCNLTTDTLDLVMAWSTHSYAEIKALIDAAIS